MVLRAALGEWHFHATRAPEVLDQLDDNAALHQPTGLDQLDVLPQFDGLNDLDFSSFMISLPLTSTKRDKGSVPAADLMWVVRIQYCFRRLIVVLSA